jgi:hypothetical protein
MPASAGPLPLEPDPEARGGILAQAAHFPEGCPGRRIWRTGTRFGVIIAVAAWMAWPERAIWLSSANLTSPFYRCRPAGMTGAPSQPCSRMIPCADPNDPCTSNASCNRCPSDEVRAVAVDVGLLLSAG